MGRHLESGSYMATNRLGVSPFSLTDGYVIDAVVVGEHWQLLWCGRWSVYERLLHRWRSPIGPIHSHKHLRRRRWPSDTCGPSQCRFTFGDKPSRLASGSSGKDEADLEELFSGQRRFRSSLRVCIDSRFSHEPKNFKNAYADAA